MIDYESMLQEHLDYLEQELAEVRLKSDTESFWHANNLRMAIRDIERRLDSLPGKAG